MAREDDVKAQLQDFEKQAKALKGDELKRQKQAQQIFTDQEKQAQKLDNSQAADYWEAKYDAAWDHFYAKNSELSKGMMGYDSFISLVFSVMEWAEARTEARYASYGKAGVAAPQVLSGLLEKALAVPAGLYSMFKNWKKGSLTLPQATLDAVSVNPDGSLQVDSVNKNNPEYLKDAPPDVVARFDELNRTMHQAFLAYKGYLADDNGIYTHKSDPNQVLTQAVFEHLKNDPQDGIKAYAAERLKVRLEQTVNKSVPGPDIEPPLPRPGSR